MTARGDGNQRTAYRVTAPRRVARRRAALLHPRYISRRRFLRRSAPNRPFLSRREPGEKTDPCSGTSAADSQVFSADSGAKAEAAASSEGLETD